MKTLQSDSECEALEAFLEARIHEFNVAATGFDDARLLGCSVRGDDGEIVAGLSGYTWGGSCTVTYLWVHASQRGQGVGQALLSEAEREAARRGCAQVVVATHSFQAPGFYERQGYVQQATVPDQPRGHADLVYLKRLPRAE